MNPSAPLIADDIFATEENLLGALVSIRNAALPAEEKAAIRDLILDYVGTTEEKRRAELKSEITKRLKPNTPAPKKSEPISTNQPVEAIAGRMRPVPLFTAAAVTTKPTEPKPREEVTAKMAVKAVEVLPKPPIPEPIKITDTPKLIPKPVEEPVRKETASVLTPPPSPTPAPSLATPLKDRINEIKHDVNRRVGNPVNLIDADEAIGREYMNALLSAMKSASTNDSSAKEALARLENVYKKVTDLVAQKNIQGKPSPKPPAPSPIPEKREPTPSVPTKEPVIKPETKNSTLLTNLMEKDKSVATTVSKLQSVSPLTTPISKPEQHKVPVKTAEIKENVSPRGDAKLSPVSTITALPEQIETLRKKSLDQETEAKKPITDLENEKVTAGLKQLLSEWKLFRGSGWFGTGPTGVNHPLYTKLAGLSMAAVVAGRFEGATPEVKQTLADYMNGWHYEQGITHEMGESFDHYLRRVILHILGKQREFSQPDQK
ncbi:hypothetical protein A2392_01060 [Candidatus Kaiserbacteria bacterium RIFOXYB1_FULL_46_14]|uniref:Uncharacterized protein n=1 Tax=Candidatus Kaiserbacteria bacterium RIFOXYB1_FULL_46_14 TaxID=1798531 RepID=A0A1F6FJL2_9BACT|nr:MAG: hypothetical protein A2392_01060 [Candidatus Kaiserbacteria bacterium RIFOXYB1_FULL_46_14]